MIRICVCLFVLALASSCGSSPSPASCSANVCNEANGGGSCDDSSGTAVCTCTDGYRGARCDACASGYVADGAACLPVTCGGDTCNEQNGGGSCDDASGDVVCTCADGYLGPNCRSCAAGFHPSGDGACAHDTSTACAPASGGASGDVQAPTLRQTLPASWDENWLASPAVVDLDGDGQMEIVAARHSVLYAWSHDGSMLWRAAWGHSASDSDDHGNTRMWASPAIGDFDGDGNLEIAVGADANGDGNVAVYDHTGELMPGWPAHFGGSDEVRAITAGDLDGDGRFEIVVNKSNTGPATAVFELDGSLRDGWPEVDHDICDPAPPAEACWDFGGYNQNIGLADLDGDGYLDVVSTYDAIGFGIFDRDGVPFTTDASFTDRVVTAVEAYHDLSLSQQGWGDGDRSEFTYSPPAMADIDGDGDLELVLVGDHESSSSTMNQGVTFWVLEPDMTRLAGWETPIDTGPPLHQDGVSLGANIVPTKPSPSVGELSDRPGLEIVAPAYDGNLYAFGADGAQLWAYPFGMGPSPYVGASEALIADLNGDGAPEVIFTTYSSGDPRMPDTPAQLIVLNANGVELHSVELDGRGSMSAPTIADVDGDGQPELILSLKDTLGGGDGGVQISGSARRRDQLPRVADRPRRLVAAGRALTFRWEPLATDAALPSSESERRRRASRLSARRAIAAEGCPGERALLLAPDRSRRLGPESGRLRPAGAGAPRCPARRRRAWSWRAAPARRGPDRAGPSPRTARGRRRRALRARRIARRRRRLPSRCSWLPSRQGVDTGPVPGDERARRRLRSRHGESAQRVISVLAPSLTAAGSPLMHQTPTQRFAMSDLTRDAVVEALKGVVDPVFDKPMLDIDTLRDIEIKDGAVYAKARVASPSDRVRDQIRERVEKALAPLGAPAVELVFDAEVPTREVMGDDPIPGVKNVILVMSGKGGVGKSTTAVNLTLALKALGARVGLLDADIYGPSIPTMMGVHGHPVSKDGKTMAPLERFGVKMMSIGFLLEDDKQAVVWRGPMLHGALSQFLSDVDWGELDFLLLDLPPGTGDVALTMAQRLKVTGAVIVTTPQEVALADVYKSVSMCDKLKLPILGVVENMSWFVDSAGVRHELFGAGGGQKVADYAKSSLLTQVPIDVSVREWGDKGMPVVQARPESEVAQAFRGAAERLVETVARSHFERTGGDKAPPSRGPTRLKIVR